MLTAAALGTGRPRASIPSTNVSRLPTGMSQRDVEMAAAHASEDAKSSNTSSEGGGTVTLNDAEGNAVAQHRNIRVATQQGSEVKEKPLPSRINYKGMSLSQAAESGNLPLCVLIWGMAAAEKVNLIVPDEFGNNPLHYAVRAETPEVMGFIYQQAKGKIGDMRLVDSTNLEGETPVLRACYTGKIPIIKALLDEGSDPFKTDKFGSTMFHILAKTANLWCLNFVYFQLTAKHGLLKTLDALSKLDYDGHSCLDWAASSGSVNIIEFLIRKGMNPLRVNRSSNRGPLFWAVSNGHVHAARFLANAGCNPFLPDPRGTTPASIARDFASNSGAGSSGGDVDAAELVEALKHYCGEYVVRGGGPGAADGSSPATLVVTEANETVLKVPGVSGAVDPSQLDFLYHSDGKSHAVHVLRPSRKLHVLLHAWLVYIAWGSSIFLPFWLWFLLVLLSTFVWRYSASPVGGASGSSGGSSSSSGGVGVGGVVGGAEKGEDDDDEPRAAGATTNEHHKGASLATSSSSSPAAAQTAATALLRRSRWSLYGFIDQHPAIRKLLTCREKYLGLWLGFAGISGTYLLCSGSGLLLPSGAVTSLFVLVVLLFVLCMLLWLSICFLHTDPGSIDTRIWDFDQVMAEGLKCGGAPPKHLYCPTMLMKKPTRAKYCVSTGLLVARMDHYCVWLNNSIGFGNHRRFLLFITAHFVLSVCFVVMISRSLNAVAVAAHALGGSWSAAILLTEPSYFFATALATGHALLSVFLLGLVSEQFFNIANNVTVNERLNKGRYYWMRDALGNEVNKFDRRSVVANFLEFFGVCGYAINYKAVHFMPLSHTQEGPRWGASQFSATLANSSSSSSSPKSSSSSSSSSSAAATASTPLSKSKQTYIQQQVMKQQRASHSKGGSAVRSQQQQQQQQSTSSTASTAPTSSGTMSDVESAGESSGGLRMQDVYSSSEDESASSSNGDRRPSVLQQRSRQRIPSPTVRESPSTVNPMMSRSVSDDFSDVESGSSVAPRG